VLATTCTNGAAQLWDVEARTPIGSPLQHQPWILDVAFGPDGRVLATAGEDDTARLWDANTRTPIGSPLRHQDAVWAVSFSPDGRVLATASMDGTARLWDADTLMPLGSPLRHQAAVFDVDFRPDGRVLATACHDQTARLWDANTHTPIGSPLRHQGMVRAVSFSPDGRVLATGSQDQTARLWDADTLMPLGPPLLHHGPVYDVSFSPDGTVLATASADGTARLWDTATLTPLGPPLRHQGAVYTVSFRRDGRTLATGSDDRTARLWDVPTPVAGDPERIVLWAQVLSAMELDARDATSVLSARDWDRRRGALESIDAPPRLSRRPPESEVDRLRREAARSESSGEWLIAHEHLGRLIAASPEDGPLHARRADVLFRLRRWAEAERDYTQAMKHGALGLRHPALHVSRGIARIWLGRWAEADADFVTDIERRGDVVSWGPHALLRLRLGDIDGYRDACATMLEWYAENASFVTSQRIAHACVLAPDAVADLERVARIGARVAALAPQSKTFREVMAATCYRAGRYEEALACLDQAAKLKSHQDGDSYGNVFRAMCHDRLGHRDEARKWLDLSKPPVGWEIPEPPDAAGLYRPPNWDLRLIVPLLRREAEAQIKEGRPLYLPANVFQEESGPARPAASRN
jgi:tetratricopeptide (TPR) repeat protein